MIKFEYKFLFHCYQFDTAPDATIRFLLSDPKEDNGVDYDKSAQVANLSYCCYNGRLFEFGIECKATSIILIQSL